MTGLESRQSSALQVAEHHYQWYRVNDAYKVPEDPDPRRLSIDRDEQYWIRQRTQPAFFQYTRLDDEYMRPEAAAVTNRRVLGEVTRLIEQTSTGAWTVNLPMHLATGHPRQRTQHLQLRAMDLYFTVARRKFDNHQQETIMEVHQTIMELRALLISMLDDGQTITFIFFAREVNRSEGNLRDYFLRCEVCAGVDVQTLFIKYENLMVHFVWQLQQIMSAMMRALTHGVDRVDPMIRLPLNEYPNIDVNMADTKKERRQQRKIVCAEELRDTSLVNSQVARDIRALFVLGGQWHENQRTWTINIQVARAAQIRQLAYWVRRMLTVYLNENNIPELLQSLGNDWTEEQSHGAIQQHMHQTPLQCHELRNFQMTTSRQYIAAYAKQAQAARLQLQPPVAPPQVTPPLQPLDWSDVPIVRYPTRQLLLPNPPQAPAAAAASRVILVEVDGQPSSSANRRGTDSRSVHQRIGQGSTTEKQYEEQQGYTPHSTDEDTHRPGAPMHQQRRREEGEIPSDGDQRPPPSDIVEIPPNSNNQPGPQHHYRSGQPPQPWIGGQWRPANPNQPSNPQGGYFQQPNRTSHGSNSDFGGPSGDRPTSRRSYRPPQDNKNRPDAGRHEGHGQGRRNKDGSSSSRRDSRDRDGRDKGPGPWTPDPDGQ